VAQAERMKCSLRHAERFAVVKRTTIQNKTRQKTRKCILLGNRVGLAGWLSLSLSLTHTPGGGGGLVASHRFHKIGNYDSFENDTSIKLEVTHRST
jgi:hypothetical protein